MRQRDEGDAACYSLRTGKVIKSSTGRISKLCDLTIRPGGKAGLLTWETNWVTDTWQSFDYFRLGTKAEETASKS